MQGLLQENFPIKGHSIYLELKEAALQSLLVHHPVVVLLCLQDACIHLTK